VLDGVSQSVRCGFVEDVVADVLTVAGVVVLGVAVVGDEAGLELPQAATATAQAEQPISVRTLRSI
jgi:hypothetical protein